MNKHDESKVERFLSKELQNNKSLGISVLTGVSGEHILFGKYYVAKEKQGYFIVSEDSLAYNRTFTTLQTAFAWCAFHNRKKFIDYNRIEKVDHVMVGIDLDIKQHTKILNNTKDTELQYIHLTKLDECKNRKQILLNELNRYVERAKVWQTNVLNTAKTSSKR
jgi:hypothetical protein